MQSKNDIGPDGSKKKLEDQQLSDEVAVTEYIVEKPLDNYQ